MTADDLPDIGKVARRELALAGITTLAAAARKSEEELLAIHGVGPKPVRIIREALALRGKGFCP
jgi:predicted flap endonuclease-1-like 5' DNA nuclease